MKIEPLTPALGAEIDIDLGNITTDGAQAVYDALIAHQVVFFRDQQMMPEQHIELAKHFGDIDVPHPVYQNHPEIPAITVLENDANRPPDTNDWHKDLTFRESPPFMSILYAEKVPVTGGDTLWANMALAYENLAPHMRDMLQTLEAVHDIGCFRNDYLGKESNIQAVNAFVHGRNIGILAKVVVSKTADVMYGLECSQHVTHVGCEVVIGQRHISPQCVAASRRHLLRVQNGHERGRFPEG